MSKYLLAMMITMAAVVMGMGQYDYQALNAEKAKKHKKNLSSLEDDQLLLYVIYNPDYAQNSVLSLNDDSSIAELRKSVRTVLLDWSRDTRNDIFTRVNIESNPAYVILNSDDVILAKSSKLGGYDDLLQFYGSAVSYDKMYQKAMDKISGNAPKDGWAELASISLQHDDRIRARGYMEEWLSYAQPGTDEKDLAILINLHKECKCSPRMDIAFAQYEKSIAEAIGMEQYLDLRQSYILSNLTRDGALEPYLVWEAYQEHLGPHADSLFRLFAIEYFRTVDPDEGILMDELYNFLYYYPDTPWEKQDQLFALAMEQTKLKDDWLLLLDLLEYQLLKEPSYRKKDYKAAILYKLGQTERAQQLMKSIEEEAFADDPDYKSIFYQTIESH